MSLSDPSAESEAQLNCMEVCGSSASTHDFFSRPGLDVWVWSTSQDMQEAGGGDLHLLSSCASGRVTRMLVADVCGVGPLFAEVATALRDQMKRHLNTISHHQMIRALSERFDEMAAKGAFASLLVTSYFAPTRSLSVCNTGHPPPLLYRQQSQTWSVAATEAPEDSKDSRRSTVDLDEYHHLQTKLEPGDMFLCYSNSFTECRDASGNVFGVEGITDLVCGLDRMEPDQMVARLAAEVAEARPENLEGEDGTLLLCRATKRGVNWRDNVMAPFRLMGAARDRTQFD